MRKTIMLIILLICAVVLLSGCLSLEKMSVFYDIDKNQTINITLEFINIHSDEDNDAEKKTEMADFYKTYIKSSEEMSSIWCLQDSKTILTKKTDYKCNAIITGKTNNLLGSLYPLTEDSTFEIRQNKDTFSVKIDSCTISAEEMPAEISIRYNGKIVSHNANTFDKQDNKMTWFGEKMKETGISFVLEIDE